MEKEKIVIVGLGWIGQANAIALLNLDYEVFYFDPAEPPHHYRAYEQSYVQLKRISDPRAEDSDHTVYIVCVGDKVAEDGVQDISRVHAALEALKGVKGTVVLRSTIIPDKLSGLSFDFYLPEFMHEKTAVEECLWPYLFVLGAKVKKDEPTFFVEWRKRAHKRFEGTPAESAHIKYIWNLWNATRIAFVNEFGNTIALPTSPENLRAVERVMDFLFDRRIYMKYGRSFGGDCLPKDTRAYVRWYKDKGLDMSLFAGVYSANEAHKLVEKKYPILPEWYSKFPERYVSAKVALQSLWHTFLKYVTLTY